ncbi:hypothetical protein E3N88_37563 [Mikania micrantha]|uniref:PGG domain-containing protein n=1 Tax=Mikania micrantha TaxID=192012 RepID=A0A5N6LRG2_9ASTR|nr:hypothetical protein E3N88_37563 [Mikania micrantha]
MDVTTKNHRQTAEEEVDVKYTVAGMVAIHSQVRKIKQEFEKTMHPAAIEQPEIRSVIREFSRLQKRSRSPLGIINRPISIGTVNRLLGLWAKLCNVCDGTNTSPLYSAVVKDHLDVVNAILDADVSCIGIVRKKMVKLHCIQQLDMVKQVQVWLMGQPCPTHLDIHFSNFVSDSANEACFEMIVKLFRLNHGSLTEGGAKHDRHVGRIDEEMQLKRTVSDIKHEVHSQLLQNKQTQRRVLGIAKELKKIHREAVQNAINSLTVVAVLFASIVFLAIFNLPGQYLNSGKQAAGISACGAFCSVAFAVVGKRSTWMGITVTVVGVPIIVGTISLCYFQFSSDVRNLNTNQNHQLSIMKVEEGKDDAEDSLMMGGDETGNAH